MAFIRDLSLVVLGAILSLGSNWFISFYKTRRKKQKLRASLKSELEAMDVIDNWVEQATPLDYPGINFVEDTVYQANAVELGLLSEEEASAITQFYSSAKMAQKEVNFQLEETRQGNISSDEAYSEIIDSMRTIAVNRQNAIGEIEDKI
ncbi:hypothetical protein G9464_02070 [Halostella sp. JP-L12]|uniref:hypothetical protein n=1 Tax=Halostella TaxID=1843185 RepID=UPI0013CEBBB4|nr:MULTISPECIES: hypothetical protein [Halostella]NHN46388.1 hypothetical protein [Halostella sp. JP-L12]